ncbi:MAG TPA: glucose-6-phosphate isomerase [Bryobacteraceae bacterium]|nr:glucose-6-phosphate isomerase [Bryobacteraceae bacterium]
MTARDLWERYRTYRCDVPSVGLTIDVSRMFFAPDFFQQMENRMQQAFGDMRALEGGAIANPDEGRMVGHYWLRSPHLAPTPELRSEIESGIEQVRSFAKQMHDEKRFRNVLCIGIGGSALGPMFVADALGGSGGSDPMRIHFLDNTDPEGIERVLDGLAAALPQTLCIVTSKSGGTPETRNGMLLVAERYRQADLNFGEHAVAITMPGSKLDRQAEADGWLARFPMFDWVGGRTSELSAVGLLPAALQGIDVDAMLSGAAAMDEATRVPDTPKNPAALLALMWFHATGGQGGRDMVVLPYKDRLLLFSRYLQQLVMESLGKELDLQGRRVEQGLSVYGNKGSTDQHAYVQQLRDGVNNFFVTFIRVLETGGDRLEVEPGVTAGDYLHGFLLGTREALGASGRESITITVNRVDARTVGALIALFERAVGLYASLVGINAYHQPGVEAGKKAAASVLELQGRVLAALSEDASDVEAISAALGAQDQVETVSLLLEHLAANGRARRVGDRYLRRMR